MRFLSTILCLLLTLTLPSCSKNDDSSPNGDSSFSATINGLDYNPQFVGGFIIGLGTKISISGSESNGNNMVINFPIEAKTGDTFTVAELEFIGSYDASDGNATVSSEGSITITAHDPEAKTVSGTFSFTAEPIVSNETTYIITNGTFNSTYKEIL